jgi:hypothetical protein
MLRRQVEDYSYSYNGQREERKRQMGNFMHLLVAFIKLSSLDEASNDSASRGGLGARLTTTLANCMVE